MDAVFKAIADPARRAIIDELAERNDQTLFEICVRLINRHDVSMSRQAVSKHIGVLRDAGLVELTTRGRTTIHHLDPAALAAARAWLDELPKGDTP